AVLEPRDVAPGIDHPDQLVVAVLVAHPADGPVQRRVVADLGHELCVAVRVEQREHGAAVVVEHALDLAVAAVLEPHAHIVAVAVAGDPATVVVLDPLPAAIGPAEALDRARGQAGITACRMRIGTRAGWQPEHLLRADHETWVIAAAVARAIAADREAHALAGQELRKLLRGLAGDEILVIEEPHGPTVLEQVAEAAGYRARLPCPAVAGMDAVIDGAARELADRGVERPRGGGGMQARPLPVDGPLDAVEVAVDADIAAGDLDPQVVLRHHELAIHGHGHEPGGVERVFHL